jgi:hypothetical protein
LRREAQKRNKQNIIDAFGERVKNTPPNLKKKKKTFQKIFSQLFTFFSLFHLWLRGSTGWKFFFFEEKKLCLRGHMSFDEPATFL